ncbi:Maf family nucleotide pyrophosphatase [Persicobacter psychrovividus]|uniref:dTTP/UTP pyrophosphatase n=1 Tax=Persicobacter psychrovividus TaxID=387638 RepID=A0ABN6L6J8_9BACT|nr:Maf-like protein [Persicobacter psychrovividus]
MNLTKKVILASQSPRRRELLQALNVDFQVRVKEVDESFDATMPAAEVAEFLACKKASAYDLSADELLITSDTVVVVDGKVLGKPIDRADAINMIESMSGKTHQVISAYCLRTANEQISGDAVTAVTFRNLSIDEIQFYVDTYKPFDKAGAYGIQEWIGMVGIEEIKGSYYNVMGLPVDKIYQALQAYRHQE